MTLDTLRPELPRFLYCIFGFSAVLLVAMVRFRLSWLGRARPQNAELSGDVIAGREECKAILVRHAEAKRKVERNMILRHINRNFHCHFYNRRLYCASGHGVAAAELSQSQTWTRKSLLPCALSLARNDTTSPAKWAHYQDSSIGFLDAILNDEISCHSSPPSAHVLLCSYQTDQCGLASTRPELRHPSPVTTATTHVNGDNFRRPVSSKTRRIRRRDHDRVNV
ncbi:hypothetical protein KC315_g44 [Hortaea werneckii]|nr:hypothetical protein KC315_g44 [Hortaea werneckii]